MELVIGILQSEVTHPKPLFQWMDTYIRWQLHHKIYPYSYRNFAVMEEILLRKSIHVDILILPASPESYTFAQQFRRTNHHTAIIYVGNDMANVFEAFPSAPIGYVAHANSPAAFQKALYHGVRWVEPSKEDFRYECKSEIINMTFHEIDYFESDYRVVHIVYSDDRENKTLPVKLDDIQSKIVAGFARSHKSYLVNLDKIAKIDKTTKQIHLHSGKVVFASKNLFTPFLETYRSYQETKGGASRESI